MCQCHLRVGAEDILTLNLISNDLFNLMGFDLHGYLFFLTLSPFNPNIPKSLTLHSFSSSVLLSNGSILNLDNVTYEAG